MRLAYTNHNGTQNYNEQIYNVFSQSLLYCFATNLFQIICLIIYKCINWCCWQCMILATLPVYVATWNVVPQHRTLYYIKWSKSHWILQFLRFFCLPSIMWSEWHILMIWMCICVCRYFIDALWHFRSFQNCRSLSSELSRVDGYVPVTNNAVPRIGLCCCWLFGYFDTYDLSNLLNKACIT